MKAHAVERRALRVLAALPVNRRILAAAEKRQQALRKAAVAAAVPRNRQAAQAIRNAILRRH